ncbi:unnamed protein product [Coregonus sp. 'balchen']|nr:unnamed protein product [Coregonus sp. 'balchen']
MARAGPVHPENENRSEPRDIPRECQHGKMVRIASVLGLMMFSVALLILSLISYVSIKKDFLFMTPKYANSGGPRMYMFHAGFRVRVGQLMHYDYSSHKYVFSVGENFKSLLPEASPIVNRHYNVCAVVGNSGILTGSRCGPEIEKFDFVFRCNFAPTEIFRRDVGRRTNLTTFNPSILEKYYNNLLTIQDRNNFFLSLKKLDRAILWIPAFFFHTSATVTRTLVDFFVEHRGQLKVQLAWPGNIMQYVNRYWKTKQLSPKRLSTGILMYTLASSMCEEIHLYGFWPFGWDPNTGKELPYHYYDKKGTKFTTKWQESHQLPAEFKLLYKMHTEGLIKLTLSHCA